jgi:hypothetical protein
MIPDSTSMRRPAALRRLFTTLLMAATTACGEGNATGPTAADAVPAPSPRPLTVTILGSGDVTSQPAGLTCSGGVCAGSFASGTSVQLTAVAGSAQRFRGWSGSCSGTTGCTLTMDRDQVVRATFEDKVEANGLSRDINGFIPDSTLRRIEAQGFPVFRGATPPRLERAIFGAPMRLIASTVNGDRLGNTMYDTWLRFSQQNDTTLTVRTDYAAGPERGRGLASYIVGTDSAFTVFARLDVVVGSDSALATFIFSGRVRSGGVADLHTAAFVIDNRGNRSGYFIPNGTGRVTRDHDRWSPETATFPATWSSEAPSTQLRAFTMADDAGLLRRP